MSRTVHRFLSFLLAACLIADPSANALAQVIQSTATPLRTTSLFMPGEFDRQALTLADCEIRHSLSRIAALFVIAGVVTVSAVSQEGKAAGQVVFPRVASHGPDIDFTFNRQTYQDGKAVIRGGKAAIQEVKTNGPMGLLNQGFTGAVQLVLNFSSSPGSQTPPVSPQYWIFKPEATLAERAAQALAPRSGSNPFNLKTPLQQGRDELVGDTPEHSDSEKENSLSRMKSHLASRSA